jgi:hypothetical protein
MKRYFIFMLLLLVCLALAQGLELFQSYSSGYYGDVAGALGFGIRDLTQSFPIGVRLMASVAGSKDILLYGFAGPRLSFYSAHFGFIGNNEVFAVRSNAFGAGGVDQVPRNAST